MSSLEPGDIMEAFTRAIESGSTEGLPLEKQHLAGEIETLLLAHRSAGGFLAPVADDDEREARAEPLRPGEIVDKWVIRREIGRGGMGVVYEAEDPEHRQRVAVKVINPTFGGSRAEADFRREALAMARLNHPAIARIYKADILEDEIGRRPYIAMQLIEGGVPITQWVKARSLSREERLELFATVCDAIAHAHGQRVLHRDIRSSNILVDGNGYPWVLDFGVAKVAAETGSCSSVMTSGAYLVGARDSVSPEQALGLPASERSDVYALGALLYQLVSDRPPLELMHGTWADVLRRLADEQPLPLRRVAPRVPKQLDDLVMRALEKDPVRRLPTPEALAEDVRAYLRGERLLNTRPITLRERMGKIIRSEPGLVTSAAAVTSALLIGAGVAFWQAQRATAARDRAEASFALFQEAANALLFDATDAILELPGGAIEGKRIVNSAMALLDESLARTPDNPDILRNLGWAYERLARVQSYSNAPNLGDDAGARVSAERAIELFDGALARAPNDTDAQRGLASALLMRYGVDEVGDESDLARSITIRSDLFAAHPDDAALAREFAESIISKRGDWPEAEEHWRRASEICRSFYRRNTDDLKTLKLLAMIQNWRGQVALRAGDAPRAERLLEDCVELWGKYSTAYPDRTSPQMERALTNAFRASARANQGFTNAEEIADEAVHFMDDLRLRDPANYRVQRGHFIVHGLGGEALHALADRTDEPEERLRLYGKAIERLEHTTDLMRDMDARGWLSDREREDYFREMEDAIEACRAATDS